MQYWYCTLAAVATLYSAVHLHVRVQQRLPVASVLEMGKSDGIIIMMMTKSQQLQLQLWDSEWRTNIYFGYDDGFTYYSYFTVFISVCQIKNVVRIIMKHSSS